MFILDNLWAHKSGLIMKILDNEDRCIMIMTPANTPEFSPIENLFSMSKRILSKRILPKEIELHALEVCKIMFGLEEKYI